MRRYSRVNASALVLTLTLSACGGHSSAPLPTMLDSETGSNSRAAAAAAGAVPHLSGDLAFTDAGRRAPAAPVNATLTLAYNHQDQLDQLVANVSDPRSGMYHDFLTKEKFDGYFAPTAAQEETVVRALQAAGFTVTHRYENRTLVDATAPSAVVERFFSTEIHTVQQGKYGQRYTNVRPAIAPSTIAALVRAISVNNLVVVRTLVEQAGTSNHRTLPVARDALGRRHIDVPPVHTMDSSGALVNGNFASGSLSPGWTNCNGRTNDVGISTAQAYGSAYSAFMGTLSPPEVNGYAGICQWITVPANGQLTFYVYQGSNEGQLGYGTTYAWQEADLLDSNGDSVDNFYTTVNNTGGWVEETVNLSAYAGNSYYLYFGVYGDGYDQTYVYQYVDAVAWAGSATPTPTPVPTATPKPTASPTAKPTASPTAVPTATAKPTASPTVKPTASPTAVPTATAKPTASPTVKPTASPTVKPTASPTASPTAAPTATPSALPSTGCNGAAADNGPLTNSDGTLGTGVAKPFDYPVQHGCNGGGYTAAIAIDDPVNTSYVSTYLAAAGITQTGTITNEAVNGGGSGDDAETDLDVQTISGLAPGANIIVYDMGSLTDANIEDTYNQVLTDGKASAVNSSFGGCESSDTSFESSTNSIAEQGASEGVEFSASSGDSGSNECGSDDNAEGVSAPAGDPYFTSVGGINFTDTSGGVLETVTEGSEDGDSGGGGVSTVVALPSWQSGITGVITSGRNQPDISLPFDPVAVYTGGAWGDYLGTSWSSPASVALFIEADELHSSKLGWLNPTLYSLFSSTGYKDYFTPCTSGTNGAYTCSATEYNQAAGIGAPKGWALANAL